MPKQRKSLRPSKDDLKNAASSRLRALRADLGVSQSAVAEAAGVTQATLSNYEAGARAMELDAAIALARYYGTTVEELVGA